MVLISMILGFMALAINFSFVFTGYGLSNPMVAFLGLGGTERLLLYPEMLYLIALGGYLASRGEDWVRLRFFSKDRV
jgi:hypothetical protein